MPKFDLYLPSYRLIFMSLLLGAFVWAGALAAQEPTKKNTAQNSAQDSGFVLRQSVRRVRVDVVVTDWFGRPIKGLQASDFRVAENGKPQSIRQFEQHTDENAAVVVPKRPPLPAHTFMNLPAVPEHGPLTVLLYDALNTPVEDQASAHNDLLAFLKKNSGRNIAIFVLSDRLHLVQGFTSDTEQLERAANGSDIAPQLSNQILVPTNQSDAFSNIAQQSALASSPMSGSALAPGMSNPMVAAKAGTEGMSKDAAAMLQEAEQEYSSYLLDRRVERTLDAFAQLGRFLAGSQGRKNLIWFSGSFMSDILPDPGDSPDPTVIPANSGRGPDPMSKYDSTRNYSEHMRKVSDLLNAAQVAIYPVDPRGLQTNVDLTAGFYETGWNSSRRYSGISHSFTVTMASEHGTMDFLAEQTGGRAFYNTNGFEKALEAAADDGNSYYSLVYAPTNTKFDGSVRRIAVQLEHGHYHLAYRRSYFADDVDPETHKHTAIDPDSASQENTAASADLMTADFQFGAPPSHQLVFAVHMDTIGAPAPATPEQMATLEHYRGQPSLIERSPSFLPMEVLDPYRERVVKPGHKKHDQPAGPDSMQEYVIQYAVLARQLDLSKSAKGRYHSDLSFAALAFNKDGKILLGTGDRVKDDIPPTKINDIRKNGYQAEQTFFVPADTAVIRFVVRDEQSGKNGSMEIRLPLPPDRQQASLAK